jgi:uncharacterized protein (DUF1697 family)
MERMVALLRAVNVGGRKLPMAELRALCEELGWSEVETYIQSGNVVFAAAGSLPKLEGKLEQAIADRFAMDVPVIVRAREQWQAYPAANPFPEAARDEPNRLMMLLSKAPPNGDAQAELQKRAKDGERVKQAGHALWIHFPAGSARSSLTPTVIDRLIGSPATARNYRTVVKIQEMLDA